MKGITGKLFSFFSGTFGGFGEIIISMAGVFWLTSGSFLDSASGWANLFIAWGMVIIVGYGVLKTVVGNILWPILFAKKLNLNVGILEKLFRFLKPIKVQRIIETTDEDNQDKIIEYVEYIEKTRRMFSGKTRRCLGMNFKKILATINANKFTILGVGAVATGAVLQGFGVIPPLSADLINGIMQGDVLDIATTAGLLIGGVAALNAMAGPGIESEAKAKQRVQAKKQGKVIDPNAIDENEAKKLAKKLGIEVEQSKLILKSKIDKAMKDAQAQQAAKELKIIQKLAKELGITEEQAKAVRVAQIQKQKK